MARSSFGKVLGLGLLAGGIAGAFSLISERPARGATLPTGTVTATVRLRRGTREKWRGAGIIPAGAPAPRWKMGDKVKVAVAVGPGEDAPPEQGKVAKVAMRVLNEVVNVLPGGGMEPVVGVPLLWSYVLDAKVGEPPVALEVAEGSLARA